MYDIEQKTEFLKERLSQKRFIHSVNVAVKSRKIAKIYGEDQDRAYFAGLLHDVCKELALEEQKKLVEISILSVTKEEMFSPPLWHAIAGAEYVNKVMGINDLDIINAIRFHTVARAGMSTLEEIVYLADLISADRTYKDVERMRKLAYADIDLAMLEALNFSIKSVIDKNGYLPHYSIDAYNQYVYICNRKRTEEKRKTNER